MRVVWLLFRVCGPAIFPLTLLVVLSAGATVFALKLVGQQLSGEVPDGTPMGLYFVGAVSLLIGSRLISRNLLDYFAMRAIVQIRYNLVQNILGLPLKQIEELGVPRIMALVFDDVVRIGAGLSGLPNFLGHVIVLAGCLIYLGFVSLYGLVALVGVLVLGVFGYRWLLLLAMHAQRDARRARDDLYELTGGMTRGVKELRFNAFRQRHLFEDSFSTTLDYHFKRSLLGAIFATTGLTLSQVLYFICLGVIVFAVPQLTPLDSGVLTKFAVIVLYLPAPIEGIVQFFSTLASAQISIERLEQTGVLGKELHHRPASPDIAEHGPLESLSVEALEYEHRSAHDGGRSFHVGPLNLSFRPGEIVFLVGGNGSGKTTALKVITGLYEADTGKIQLNGQLITKDNMNWYRQHFSGVYSDYHVFDSYAPNANNETFSHAENAKGHLDRLNLSHVVKLTGEKLSTTTKLSTGQRKRLALLTVLLDDKPVVVFDEWASDQDPAFRAEFYTSILPELAAQGKVVLVVTHDDDYFSVADRIITFRYGQVESDVLNKRELVRRPAIINEG
ncbi:cyclic peptide export ABC transporter [Breoghania sp.]|uniref:cyclic peptide export ABC transporter n=1 Tax=Breoghania sp. TaxID=2065378 RepID=UPI002AA8B879|nr:cyclic peptide export ABC transporter [Breoghania sp.]